MSRWKTPILTWRWLSKLFVVPAMIAACGHVGQTAAAKPERLPNIVWIMADDLGYGDVGCFGATHVKTPSVDRLAKEGIRFTDAHSESACCTPTRYGVLTGRYSWRGALKSGVLAWDAPLLIEKDRLTVPALLRSAGYATACIGKWHLGIGEPAAKGGGPLSRGQFQPGPLEVGFDFFCGMPGDNHGNPVLVNNHQFVDPADARNIRGFADEKLRRRKQEQIGPTLAKQAVEFIERNKDRPFFLYYTPCAIHLPYTPSKQFQGSSGAGPRGDFIQELDWAVGQVLETLDRLHLDDRTLVVFASDNGGDEHNSTGGFRASKTSVYEGGHRVPFVARWPGKIKAAATSAETICLSDLMATSAAIVGKSLPDDAGEDSFNILPLLVGEKPAAPIRPGMINKACRGASISIRQGPWKLVMPAGFWPNAQGIAALEGGKLGKGELYSLADDPRETKDLYAQQPETAQRLSRLMVQFIREGRSRPKVTELTALLKQATAAAVQPKARPNVVLIISDDQGWTDFGFMGHPQIRTPHLDKLASQGLLFPRGYVPSSLCCPSLASIITGQYPHQHKITCNDPPGNIQSAKWRAGREQLDRRMEAAPTLPRLLAQHGYLSFQAGKWWQDNFARGGFTHGMTTGDPKKGGRHGDQGLDIGRKTMQPVFDFIRQAQGDGKPFFVWYAPMLPHQPHNPPERLLAHYRGQAPNEAVAKYWGMVEWFDETCGQLLDFLDQQNLASNTLVLYVTDNGWIQAPDGGSVRSKLTPYDAGLRTPIILRWPQHIKPRRCDEPAMSIDLHPTVVAALGIERPAGLSGINLLDEAAVAARKTICGECYLHTFVALDRPAANLLWRWIIADDWKLIVPHGAEAAKGKPELYNLAADPQEKSDLAGREQDRVETLRRKLDAWWSPQ